MIESRSYRFAEMARRLGTAARAAGLNVPSFRSPPRQPNVDRSIRRTVGGSVVAVRLGDRPLPDVLADLVDGVLIVNDLNPTIDAELRSQLLQSVEEVTP